MYEFIFSIQKKLPTDKFHMGFYWLLESLGDWLWLVNDSMYGEDWTLEDETKEFFNNLGK
jgi:hypothetical protein